MKNRESMLVSAMISFIDRMAQRHGSVVYDADGGSWDWGQAVCRELYGSNWSKDPRLPDEPPPAAWAVMARWDSADFPGWLVLAPSTE